MASPIKLACVVVMCMAVVCAPMTAQAMTCNDMVGNLAPCLSYLMQGGAVSATCCNGVRTILGSAGTTSDKQTVCNCLKTAANTYPINDNYAQALPGLCNVNVPYKISRSTNCAAGAVEMDTQDPEGNVQQMIKRISAENSLRHIRMLPIHKAWTLCKESHTLAQGTILRNRAWLHLGYSRAVEI
ncbi:Non-specific lipid-transfer protein [Spatholobus suberectus]|nr:Non-specific lipid-transfer protein [Spatholobus suberectus]